ncbi:MAG: hypothetical protein DI568_07710 [Sphingomonas sp.]|nr:MAG: hypothetical protein DI568_07710 [Sphingomonas sp.]
MRCRSAFGSLANSSARSNLEQFRLPPHTNSLGVPLQDIAKLDSAVLYKFGRKLCLIKLAVKREQMLWGCGIGRSQMGSFIDAL